VGGPRIVIGYQSPPPEAANASNGIEVNHKEHKEHKEKKFEGKLDLEIATEIRSNMGYQSNLFYPD
jgi:hypothetical protein